MLIVKIPMQINPSSIRINESQPPVANESLQLNSRVLKNYHARDNLNYSIWISSIISLALLALWIGGRHIYTRYQQNIAVLEKSLNEVRYKLNQLEQPGVSSADKDSAYTQRFAREVNFLDSHIRAHQQRITKLEQQSSTPGINPAKIENLLSQPQISQLQEMYVNQTKKELNRINEIGLVRYQDIKFYIKKLLLLVRLRICASNSGPFREAWGALDQVLGVSTFPGYKRKQMSYFAFKGVPDWVELSHQFLALSLSEDRNIAKDLWNVWRRLMNFVMINKDSSGSNNIIPVNLTPSQERVLLGLRNRDSMLLLDLIGHFSAHPHYQEWAQAVRMRMELEVLVDQIQEFIEAEDVFIDRL